MDVEADGHSAQRATNSGSAPDVIDLFQRLERQHAGARVRELAGLEFDRITDYLGHPPSLVEYETWLSDEVREKIRYRPVPENPLKDWIRFLVHRKALGEEEQELLPLLGTVAHSFLTMLQTTAMAKSYKMPLLLAFHRDGRLHPDETPAAIVASFRSFYAKNVHGEERVWETA